MGQHIGEVGSVVINVTDMDAQKSFWGSFLGVGVRQEFPGFFCWFEPQRAGGISVALQTSPDPGPAHGRVHLDTTVPNIAEARAAIEAIGGSHVEDHEVEGFNWTIMADPEGNRFCIAETH